MDRKIVYPAQIPMVEDQLLASRFTQIGIGRLAGALFGEGGLGASGLTCTPASGMTVSIAPGQIIQSAPVDATSYGVLSADSDVILTQYLLNEAVSVAVPGVGATYTVYGTLSVTDIDNAVLPFYNSADPSQVYAGPDNNGASTATTRASIITVGIGTSVPSGSVPLWQIVVPSAATSISASMISAASGAPIYPSLAQIAPRIIAPFNATLAQAFGGYPINAIVCDAATTGTFWVSTAAANTTTPGATGASWQSLFTGLQAAGDYATVDDFNNAISALTWTQIGASQTLTPPSWAAQIEVIQIGAGGGGAGCQGTAQTDSVSGAGGGAGGILRSRHLIAGTISQYVGSGGSGGNGGASGAKGGDTYLVINGSTVATAGGGGGGDTYGTGGSSGGSGGTNTFVSGGLVGSYAGSGGSDGQQGKYLFLGNGAPGYLGAGAGRAGSSGGTPGTSAGAGGGGAYDGNLSGTSYGGGTGASGACLYRWLP